MKTVITTLVLMAATVASALATPPRETSSLPTQIVGINVFSPIGITVWWKPVRIYRDPVKGYKVNLRAFEGTLKNKIETVHGTEVLLVDEMAMPEVRNVTLESPHKLHQYVINNADQRGLTIHGIKKETTYMLDVLPYSDKGDGPTSPVLVFQIRKDREIKFFGRHNEVVINSLSFFDAK